MSFATELNRYCTMLGCSSTELAKASGLTSGTLSRYRSGARTPTDQQALVALAAGISKLAQERGVAEAADEREVLERLSAIVGHATTLGLSFGLRLDELMASLSISNAELARSANVDPSYLSRIRRGQRNPYDVDLYANLFARFIAHRIVLRGDVDGLPLPVGDASLVETALRKGDEMMIASVLSAWLLRNDDDTRVGSGAEHLLSYLDDFDFNAYVKNVHYDELRVPTVPIIVSRSRFYYGVEEMRKAEIDFLRTVATSRDAHEATLYSNMSMVEMGADQTFMQHYVMGLAAVLKRGVHLNVIHDLTRPFNEMMMGLEGYIPLYMTGQISPYYLREEVEGVFCQLMNASDVAMLEAECVRGNHDDGRYFFSTKREDVQYGMRRAKHLLEHATPLMRIYRADEPTSLERFERRMRRLELEGTGEVVGENTFRNLRITSYGDDLVIVSKLNEPIIHFEIRHPMLCHAISHMEPEYVEAARIQLSTE